MLTSFDAYRTHIHALRVTYAVGDMHSRAHTPVKRQTITGLGKVFDGLAIGQHNTSILATSIV